MISRNIEPLVRPLLQAWFRLRRGMTLGVRGIVLDEAGQVILVRHSYQLGWRLPGGGVERGETAEQAMMRELEEEAGVRPTEPLRLVSIHSQHRQFPGDHVLVYRVAAWTPCPARPGAEIAEVRRFSLEALPDDMPRADRARLAEAFDGAATGAEW